MNGQRNVWEHGSASRRVAGPVRVDLGEPGMTGGSDEDDVDGFSRRWTCVKAAATRGNSDVDVDESNDVRRSCWPKGGGEQGYNSPSRAGQTANQGTLSRLKVPARRSAC
jgi:hypothetical protein